MSCVGTMESQHPAIATSTIVLSSAYTTHVSLTEKLLNRTRKNVRQVLDLWNT